MQANVPFLMRALRLGLLYCLSFFVHVAARAEVSPGEVFRAMVTAANEGRTKGAMSHFDQDSRLRFEAAPAGAQFFLDMMTRERTVENFEILKEEVSGGKARVTVKVHHTDGSSQQPFVCAFRLDVKAWRLTVSPATPFPLLIYWRPEFPVRTETPEKSAAFSRLMVDLKVTSERVIQLNSEIESSRFAGDELKRRYDERDYSIRRHRALQAEARLWQH